MFRGGNSGGPPQGEAGAPNASPASPRPHLSPSWSPPSPASALVGRSRTLPPPRSPLQVSPRDPKPQGSQSRPSRHPKSPLREAWVLSGVFTPKGLVWDIFSIFNYFLNPAPLLRLPAAQAARRSLPPPSPSLPHLSPPTPPTAAPGPRGPSPTIFSIVGNDRAGSGGPDGAKNETPGASRIFLLIF